MGRWKAFIPIALALVIAVGGSVFLYKWLKIKTAPKEVVQKVESEAVNVVVAVVDLPWGTKIQKEMLKTAPFLKESLPNGYQSDPNKLVGRVVISPLQATEAVLESRLAPENVTVGGVSAVIKPGMRAIAVKGNKIIGISGFIKPGNRVDVLVTLKDPRNKSETTKMVLSNVLVLATGTEIQENQDGKASPVDVYTLEVDPEQAERLALSAAEGKLQFALRNNMDMETVLTKGATIPKTLASLRGADPKVKTPTKVKTWVPRKRSLTVETIKGDKVGKQKFNL
ncbi:Flp pilus assembly protein CpaB [Desulfosarcina widdelii]|uniref:Flp pilus assembly protein CpaB n=1 Tax=Desulfosarcina widdelii TaxID=947919 RepID=A0A5K7ZFR0_9BACT|nr:Flp pilus assembly protein CpaB [Desulfosarcina widdelii]BBO74947.1 Flp pilus assembly protein CpaB [Desulfosarcina widdelii]